MESRKAPSKFEDGQRVKIRVTCEDGKPFDYLPYGYIKYDGKIGYITNTLDPSDRPWEYQSASYEVMVTKIGTTLSLPEECLEPARSRHLAL